MKKLTALAVAGALLLSAIPTLAKQSECVTIPDENLTYSTGHYLAAEPLMKGYDLFGYNYQAHMFNGSYANAYLGRDGFSQYEGDDEAYLAENPGANNHWAWPYRDVQLMMKWSDEWLSNEDCNGDEKLDRGYSCDSVNADNSACAGSWLTNHQSGTEDGKKWTYFTKIAAKPTAEFVCEGVGGEEIWGSFCSILGVNGGYPELNETFGGNGAVLKAHPPGFGYWQP